LGGYSGGLDRKRILLALEGSLPAGGPGGEGRVGLTPDARRAIG
jgi:hypothetical protein